MQGPSVDREAVHVADRAVEAYLGQLAFLDVASAEVAPLVERMQGLHVELEVPEVDLAASQGVHPSVEVLSGPYLAVLALEGLVEENLVALEVCSNQALEDLGVAVLD